MSLTREPPVERSVHRVLDVDAVAHLGRPASVVGTILATVAAGGVGAGAIAATVGATIVLAVHLRSDLVRRLIVARDGFELGVLGARHFEPWDHVATVTWTERVVTLTRVDRTQLRLGLVRDGRAMLVTRVLPEPLGTLGRNIAETVAWYRLRQKRPPKLEAELAARGGATRRAGARRRRRWPAETTTAPRRCTHRSSR